MPDEMTMPEPTGEYAKVPQGWHPQTWGAHLARIEFMKAMGHDHYSITDPVWNVKRFREGVLQDERARIIRIIGAQIPSLEEAALKIDLSGGDSGWVRSKIELLRDLIGKVKEGFQPGITDNVR